MDYLSPNSDIAVPPGPKKSWTLPRILIALLLTVLVFGGGIAVGRGDLHLKGLSLSKTTTSQAAFDYNSVDQLYNLLKNNFDGSLDNEKLLDGIKTGLVNAADDPYTQYFNPEDAKLFNEELTGSFSGIGAELGTDANNNIVIVAPLSGYPAEAAGLKPKDIISAIDGETTSGIGVDRAVRKIRGDVGTQVKLTVLRGSQPAFELTITRAQITIPSVSYSAEGVIGYLKISQFTNDTLKLTKEAASDFKTKNIKGIILDLRSDPGGYLSGAVDISSLWLDKGKVVVAQKRGNQTLATEYAKGDASLKGLPTVVLINSGSASASEITAGALRDNGAATIVGEKSFGKGSIQQVQSLPGGGELKVTIARWFTPSGKNIDKQGITPDIEVLISDDDQKAGRDPQKDRATQILSAKIQ